MDKLSLEISEGTIFDVEFGLPGATFAQRVEAARDALDHLLWRFAEAMDEPTVSGADDVDLPEGAVA